MNGTKKGAVNMSHVREAVEAWKQELLAEREQAKRQIEAKEKQVEIARAKYEIAERAAGRLADTQKEIFVEYNVTALQASARALEEELESLKEAKKTREMHLQLLVDQIERNLKKS